MKVFNPKQSLMRVGCGCGEPSSCHVSDTQIFSKYYPSFSTRKTLHENWFTVDFNSTHPFSKRDSRPNLIANRMPFTRRGSESYDFIIDFLRNYQNVSQINPSAHQMSYSFIKRILLHEETNSKSYTIIFPHIQTTKIGGGVEG